MKQNIFIAAIVTMVVAAVAVFVGTRNPFPAVNIQPTPSVVLVPAGNGLSLPSVSYGCGTRPVVISKEGWLFDSRSAGVSEFLSSFEVSTLGKAPDKPDFQLLNAVTGGGWDGSSRPFPFEAKVKEVTAVSTPIVVLPSSSDISVLLKSLPAVPPTEPNAVTKLCGTPRVHVVYSPGLRTRAERRWVPRPWLPTTHVATLMPEATGEAIADWPTGYEAIIRDLGIGEFAGAGAVAETVVSATSEPGMWAVWRRAPALDPLWKKSVFFPLTDAHGVARFELSARDKMRGMATANLTRSDPQLGQKLGVCPVPDAQNPWAAIGIECDESAAVVPPFGVFEARGSKPFAMDFVAAPLDSSPKVGGGHAGVLQWVVIQRSGEAGSLSSLLLGVSEKIKSRTRTGNEGP